MTNFGRHLLRAPLFALALAAVATPLAACSGSTDVSDGVDSGGAPSDTATSGDTTSGADTASGTDTAGGTDTGSPSDGTSSETAIDAGGDVASGVDYSLAGPFAVTKSDTTVGTNAVHVLVPATSPGATRPAIVFAHGFQLKNTDYDNLLAHLASWGFVVVSTDFPGSLLSIDHRDVQKAIIAAKDALVAGTITGAPKIDATKIVAAGHSLGGKGSIMAVLADSSFVADLAFDPVDGSPGGFGGGTPDAAHPMLSPTETAKLKIPVGYFGATLSHCLKLGQACAPTGNDAATFYAGTPATIPRYLWTLTAFGHMQFLDADCGFTCSTCVAGADPTSRRPTLKGTAAAFLVRHVLGDASAQSWLDGAKHDAAVSGGFLLAPGAAMPACP